MTPQLMQAIKLLQLSNLDLAAYVEAELEQNPLLERVDDPERARAAEDAAASAEPSEAGQGSAATAEERSAEASDADQAERGNQLDASFDDGPAEEGAEAPPAPRVEGPGYSEWAGVGAGGRDDDDYNLEAFVSAEVTLADHLSRQLMLTITEPVQRIIAQHLVDLVDEAGYLRGDLPAVAEKLGAPLAEIEAVLAILQTFDPPGVCARDLAECLTIQLKERNRYDPAMAALVANLDLLAKRDFGVLKRVTAVDEEDLTDMIAEVRRLNPKPGLAFGGGVVQPIVPDVFVRPAPDGSWNVELNADTLPRVLVNQSYYASVSKTAKERKGKEFSRRMFSNGDVADPFARSTRPHDLEGFDRDRAPAGRLLGAWRAAFAAVESAHRRRRHRHARIDRVARDRE